MKTNISGESGKYARLKLVGFCLLMLCSLATGVRSPAQVMWSFDFDSTLGTPIVVSGGGVGSPGYHFEHAGLANPSGAQSNYCVLNSNFSTCTNRQKDYLTLGGFRKQFTGFEPERTYLIFDALASELKPIWVKLEYDYFGGGRQLETYVFPQTTNSYQHYKLLVSSFPTTNQDDSAPDYPTGLDIGFDYDESRPAYSWGHEGLKTLLVDNISYYVEPPALTITSVNGMVQVSWPTNASGFILQSTLSVARGEWADVGTTPAVADKNYVVYLANPPFVNFFRLKGSY